MTKTYVFRIGHLGDSLAVLPALKILWEKQAPIPFTLITHVPAHPSYITAWDVLKHTGLFDRVLFYDSRRPWTLARIATDMRRAKSPLLYYLVPAGRRQRLRDWFFFRILCGARIKGWSLGDRRPLRNPERALLRLPREYERLLAFACGSETHRVEPPLLVPNGEVRSKVDALLQDFRGRPLVALGIGSKMPAKKWFYERYLEIARRIVSSQPSVRIVLVGGKEDETEGSRLRSQLGSGVVLNLAGSLDIVESAEVLSRCILYVGNDSGAMHLAASMGVQCIAIFSSRDNPGLWEPFGDGHVILRRELECSGCMLSECIARRMECLRRITVDDVWNAVGLALEDRLESREKMLM